MKRIKNSHSVAIIIPVHNEALVLEKTLRNVLSILLPQDIYIVDDASNDASSKLARKFTKHVLVLKKNSGKAAALNQAIEHFRLCRKYQFILPLDADTQIASSFIDAAHRMFSRYPDTIAVVGKIHSRKSNWISSYRAWEYELAQTLHKHAQGILHAILVCSGCATLYKSSVFLTNTFPTGTLTEDMDLTFLIHRKQLGTIRYASRAIVYTQDPRMLRDYMRQTLRWFTGFWQCVVKHNVPWGGQMLDFEAGILAVEGLFSGLLMLLLPILIPTIFTVRPSFLLLAFGIDISILMLPSIILAAKRQQHWELLHLIPVLYFMRFLTSIMFIGGFIRTMLVPEYLYKWNKVRRYTI